MMVSEARDRSSSTTRRAVALARSDFTLISSGGAIAAIMLYGAAGFCLGIDLPLAPERLRELPLRRLGSKTDAVELLSSAGTFLTVIAVSSIILGEIAHSRKRGYRPARLDSRRVHADCRRNHRAITRGYFLRLNGPFVRRLRSIT
jgi:hypothetical protein